MTAVEWIGEGDAAVKAAGIKPGNDQIGRGGYRRWGEKFTLAIGNKDPLAAPA